MLSLTTVAIIAVAGTVAVAIVAAALSCLCCRG